MDCSDYIDITGFLSYNILNKMGIYSLVPEVAQINNIRRGVLNA